jgi:hypothetical protein
VPGQFVPTILPIDNQNFLRRLATQVTLASDKVHELLNRQAK